MDLQDLNIDVYKRQDVLEALEMRGASSPVSLDTLPPEDDESAPLSVFLGQEEMCIRDS